MAQGSAPNIDGSKPNYAKKTSTLLYDPGNVKAACWNCHTGAIQSEEALGYDTTIGTGGWPLDAKHPSVGL